MRLTGLGLGLIATLLIVLAKLSGLSAYEDLELRAFDAFIQHRPQPTARTDLVHVDIDDQAIEQVGRWQDWSRTHHAHLVTTLRELGARAVLFDIEFPEPTRPQLEEDALTQTVTMPLEAQAQALQKAVGELTEEIQSRENPVVSAEEFRDVLGQVSQVFGDTAALVQGKLSEGVERPDEHFARAAQAAGTVYLALSVVPPSADRLEASLADRAVDLLRQDLWKTPAELAQALGVPEGRILEGVTALREQAALTEAELMLISDPGTPLEALLERLLGHSSVSVAQEHLVGRAYDQARSLRVLLAESRTPLPAQAQEKLHQGSRVVPPVSVLSEAAAGLGVVNAVPDRDGKLRRSHLFWEFRGHLLPHLSVVFLSDLLDVRLESIRVEPGTAVRFPAAAFPGEERRREVVIPVDEEGGALINWALASPSDRGRSPYGDPFPRVSAATVLELWDLNRVLEQTYLALDDYTGGRQAKLLGQLEQLAPSAAAGKDAESLRTELKEVREELRQFLARQVEKTQSRIDNSTDEAERAELVAALEPLREEFQVLGRRETRRRQILDYLEPVVADAVSIVGPTFTAGTDFHPVPFHTHLPGVCHYSHLLNMVLEGQFLRRGSPVAAIAAILLCGLLAGVFSATMRASRSGVWTVLVVAVQVAFSYWCFIDRGLWLDAVGPGIASLASFTLVTSYRQLTEERQKRWIRNVFQHYLSPEVVTEVLEQPDQLGLRGRIQEVTVFFSDLADFTSIAERLPPEELTQLLNDYFTPMSNIIQEHGGCLDKYEGDLIMSFFGAPVPYADHARRACLAALENQARLAEMREEFRQKGRPLLYARIGLATGPVRVGNMGSEMRFDYTVMGDYANLASRLEGVNKLYNTSILISESTQRAANDAIRVRELDLVRVKGRAEPVRIYELLARMGELASDWERVLELFADGLQLYRARQWEQAAERFQQALDLRPQDGPAATFVARCREYLASPPPEDWGSVFVAAEK